MASGRKKESGWGGWALIVFLFALGVWPVALLLLFFKLFGSDEKKPQTAPPLQTATMRTSQRVSQRQGAKVQSTAKQMVRSPSPKKSNARLLKIIGAVVAVLGLLSASSPLDMVLAGYIQNWIGDLLQCLAVAAAGGAMFGAGVSMDRSVKRYAKYLSVMGDREAMSVEELARTLGYAESRVEKDLQKMIDKGYFGGKAYFNVELGYLFRSSQADAEFQRKQKEAAAKPPKEAEEGYSGILRDIRRANDAIADPVLSAKIDRLEEIAAKIFRAVEQDPKKRGKIDTFLNYYLPTTQKLLDSYAQFEAAGVEGENLRQAKSRIESTMDAIVRGFEHQLDELYQADALDVDSDIRVMETMLGRDTASVEKDFGLGGTAAQEEKQ